MVKFIPEERLQQRTVEKGVQMLVVVVPAVPETMKENQKNETEIREKIKMIQKMRANENKRRE